jgi:hypothetical protein
LRCIKLRSVSKDLSISDRPFTQLVS